MTKPQEKFDIEMQKLIKKYNVQGYIALVDGEMNLKFKNNMIMRECAYFLNRMVEITASKDNIRLAGHVNRAIENKKTENYLG